MRRRKNNTRPVNAEAIEAAEREFAAPVNAEDFAAAEIEFTKKAAASVEAFELAAKELAEAREALRPLD